LRLYGFSKGGPARGVHREKLAYGKRVNGSHLESHKREAQIIKSIKEMYQKNGLGPVAIARILDTMKVPTKKQGKKWDHSVVKAILEREGIYKKTRKSPREV
jgi:Recombinase